MRPHTGLAALASASLPHRRAFGATASADLGAVGLDGAALTLNGSVIDELRAALRGELIAPGSPARILRDGCGIRPSIATRR